MKVTYTNGNLTELKVSTHFVCLNTFLAMFVKGICQFQLLKYQLKRVTGSWPWVCFIVKGSLYVKGYCVMEVESYLCHVCSKYRDMFVYVLCWLCCLHIVPVMFLSFLKLSLTCSDVSM